MNGANHYDAIVIGAGIAGLAAATKLRRAGQSVVVLEARDRVGGVIDSEVVDGFTIEWGPNSVLGASPTIRELAADVGLEPIDAAPAARSRYIYRDGELRRLPTGPLSLVTSRVLSLRGKLRLLREPWRSRGSDDAESVADFFGRRFGSEVVDYLVDPFVSGIYGGSAAALEMKSSFPQLFEAERGAGSVVRGLLRKRGEERLERGAGEVGPKHSRRPFTFSGGLGELTGALGQALGEEVRTSVNVISLSRVDDHWDVQGETSRGVEGWRGKQVVIATPSYAAATLVGAVSSELAGALAAIEYAPISVHQIGVRRDEIQRHLDGFGFLVPSSERLPILGCIWASAVFPNRAPDDCELLTVFAGGWGNRSFVTLSLDEQRKLVRDALHQTLGKLPPARIELSRDLPRAIPQYLLGHAERVATIERCVSELPGLHLVGNYLRGISVEGAAGSGVSALRE